MVTPTNNHEPGMMQQLGNYRLIRPLRRGGYATIYLGRHLYLRTPGALKVLNTWFATESDMQRFLSEAALHARLRHTHIVRVLDFGIEGQIPYMVMDYAPHGTLNDRFPQRSVVKLQAVLPYVLQIGAALQYMHDNGILHCDVKPQNILLGPQHEAWLCDFGIATSLNPRQTWGGTSNGTVLYAAPEQIRGQAERASDQYALGIMLYTWLCGRYPFQGTSTQICHQHLYIQPERIRALAPDVPVMVEQAVLRALAKDPAQRFPSIAAFVSALERAARTQTPYEGMPFTFARSLLRMRR